MRLHLFLTGSGCTAQWLCTSVVCMHLCMYIFVCVTSLFVCTVDYVNVVNAHICVHL